MLLAMCQSSQADVAVPVRAAVLCACRAYVVLHKCADGLTGACLLKSHCTCTHQERAPHASLLRCICYVTQPSTLNPKPTCSHYTALDWISICSQNPGHKVGADRHSFGYAEPRGDTGVSEW